MMNLSGRSFAYCLREIPPLAFTISAQVSIIFLNGATSDENGPVIETVTPTKMAAGALTWESTAGVWTARCRAARTKHAADRLAKRADRDFLYRPILTPVLRRHEAGSNTMAALRRDRPSAWESRRGRGEGQCRLSGMAPSP